MLPACLFCSSEAALRTCLPFPQGQLHHGDLDALRGGTIAQLQEQAKAQAAAAAAAAIAQQQAIAEQARLQQQMQAQQQVCSNGCNYMACK